MSTIKIVAIIIAAILGLWLIGMAVGIVSLPFHSASKQLETATGIVDKTYTADNAIYNYEWFASQKQKIDAAQKNSELTKAQLIDFKAVHGNASAWDYATNMNYQTLYTTYTGQVQYTNNLIGDYNARASMANRNIFNDKLPMFVDELALW